MADESGKIGNKEMLEKIVKTECGCRPCKCGDSKCEFAADFFDENGVPTLAFGADEDLIENQNLEAAEDYSDYAMRTGLSGDGRILPEDAAVQNGQPMYHNTASYRMIDPDDSSIDACKS